jgi:hypothetical protein
MDKQDNTAKHAVLSAMLQVLGEEQDEAELSRDKDGGLSDAEFKQDDAVREWERGRYEPLRTRWVSLWEMRNSELENEPTEDYLGLLDSVDE